MVLAISLIKAVPDQEKVVYRALKEMGGIKNLYHIFGNHDFFLILEAGSMDHLNKPVFLRGCAAAVLLWIGISLRTDTPPVRPL